jgi:hypothetical protein
VDGRAEWRQGICAKKGRFGPQLRAGWSGRHEAWRRYARAVAGMIIQLVGGGRSRSAEGATCFSMYLLADLTLDAGVGVLQVCTLLSEVCYFDLLSGQWRVNATSGSCTENSVLTDFWTAVMICLNISSTVGPLRGLSDAMVG